MSDFEERVRLRAYLHFKERTGVNWSDAVSNWCQAELEELQQTQLKLLPAYERHLRSKVTKLLSETQAARLPVPSDQPAEAISNIMKYLAAFYSRARRRIPPLQRRVHLSAQFASNQARATHEDRLSELFRLFESGSSEINDPARGFVSRRMSWFVNRRERMDHALFLDALLHQWGIHHFHLGWPRRTDDLLFAIVGDEDVFVIDIGVHFSENELNLHDQRLLSVVEENWPGLLPRLNGITGDTLTSRQVRNLRRANAGFAPSMGEATLAPMDVFSAGGIPFNIVRLTDMVVFELGNLEKHFASDAFRSEVAPRVGRTPDRLALAVLDDDEVPENDENFRGCLYLKAVTTTFCIRVALNWSDLLSGETSAIDKANQLVDAAM